MIYDVLGIGFGPSNIALGIAMEEAGYTGNVLFLERGANSRWHEGMLLEGADIQNNPLRDLITPVNPRSKYSFVNFLHESGRLFEHLNLGRLHPFRRDYFDYVAWVADQFENVRYNSEVTAVDRFIRDGEPLWRVIVNGQQLVCRHLVMGIGRNLNIPEQFELGARVVHFTQYLPAIKSCPKDTPVTVVGASQSAVEILIDLLGRGFNQIVSVHRNFSFRLKDTSPFSDEVYFPEFVDYYHRLSSEKRRRLDAQVRATNYSSVDGDILESLYQRIYELRIDGRHPLSIRRSTEILNARTSDDAVHLTLREQFTEECTELHTGLVILATGFLDVGRNGMAGLPKLLQSHGEAFLWADEHLIVGRDYRVQTTQTAGQASFSLFLNGLCESSHGMGDAGSFSLVSVRANTIFSSISGIP